MSSAGNRARALASRAMAHPDHVRAMAGPRRREFGVWLVARTPTSKPYPCLCQGYPTCRRSRCQCDGRQVYAKRGSCCATVVQR